MKEYEEVRSNLLAMLEDLDERLGKITEDVKHVEDPPAKDFAEQATQMENNEVLDSLGNIARYERVILQQAIDRIDSGKYGFCVVCGKPIRQERLKALPFSIKCIDCAKAADND